MTECKIGQIVKIHDRKGNITFIAKMKAEYLEEEHFLLMPANEEEQDQWLEFLEEGQDDDYELVVYLRGEPVELVLTREQLEEASESDTLVEDGAPAPFPVPKGVFQVIGQEGCTINIYITQNHG